MAKIIQEIKHNSGIPLGGIGTGTVEIRPDGLFHEWQIFNNDSWNPNIHFNIGDALNDTDNVFLVRTKDASGNVVMRFLALDETLLDFYSMPYLKCVERIEYEGRFPQAKLKYIDKMLPVDIEAEFISPFIPLDEKASGIPGFYVKFNVKNKTEETVDVSILNLMVNPVALGQDEAKAFNNVVEASGNVKILFSADNMSEGHPTTGNMAVSLKGGTVSYIAGGYKKERYGRFFYSPIYGTKGYSYLNIFKEHGFLPDISYPRKPQIEEGFKAEDLNHDARVKLLYDLSKIPFVFDKCRVIGEITDIMEDDQELIRFIDDTVLNIKEMAAIPWGEAGLCSKFTLEPGTYNTVQFTYSWYFPKHLSKDDTNIGHMYENWYSNSFEVNEDMVNNGENYIGKAEKFVNAIYGNGLSELISDTATVQLSTLNKCTWWTKDGSFGVWEGLGCCGLHTTDITYQGSFPIISLFPNLQKKQMAQGAAFQREDGRVHHFFTPDFSSVDNGFDRVDMNQQFVMLVSRDYQWTGDKEYLDKMYEHVVKAMDSIEKLDANNDGLPDKDTKRNTYDAWDFSGTPSYISSLWLGALKSAVKLAEAKGDEENSKKWKTLLEKGTKTFENKLWNGEYYVLWKDEEGNTDECCMTDQISAEWYLSVMDWDNVLNKDRIKKTLQSILKYNFKPDTGLINASYPEYADMKMFTYSNAQANATWTGIEYTIASLLIRFDMISEAMEVINDINKRYMQGGRVWNHVECGNHYYRAMSSWTVLLTLTGFAFDAVCGMLKIKPKVKKDSVKYPYFTPFFWGLYDEKKTKNMYEYNISVSDGSFVLKKLILPKADFTNTNNQAKVLHNGIDINAEVQKNDDEIIVMFDSLKLNTGDKLTVLDYVKIKS